MTYIFVDKKNVTIAVVILAVIFGLGVIIGYYGRDVPISEADTFIHDVMVDQFKDEAKLIDLALEKVDSNNLREYLKILTQEPHLAGLRRDNELTKWIKENWENNGLDKVELAEYDFYLSWPNKTNPNKIYIIDGNGTELFVSNHKEKELREGDSHPEFVDAFNAYSAAGTVEGELVYVHYGRVEDIRQLQNQLGVNVTGKICMARYGKIFRGNKVKNCQDAGAIGVIIFSDPGDVAINGTEPDKVYPNSIFLPGSGVQRGSVFIGDGDPLSPNWASVPHAHRVKPESVEGLPKIPSQPIGYDDAKVLLEKMAGNEVPEEWKGQIKGITYRLGGSMSPQDLKIKLSVNNYFGTTQSSNVIGYIRGSVEPDRYVIMSNHRDAWGFGSVDPSSGTAQLMEVTRIFGEMLKSGWRPRRTIILASWAAEEYGLEGSYEWVSQHTAKLMHRAIGLVNTDVCVSGPIAKPNATPVLRDVVVNALKKADDPTPQSSRKYYEFWEEWTNLDNADEGARKLPEITHLGSGSDHAPFAFYANIPAVNLRFKDDTKKYKGVGQYPMYHTSYETFYLVDKIIDPGFRIHRTCAQTSLHILLELADSVVIPYNLHRFPAAMKEALESFDKDNITSQLKMGGISMEHVKKAVDDFEAATNLFMSGLENLKTSKDPMELRIVNDQMMQLERVFNMPTGIPGRPEIRNAIFAPGAFNNYGSSAFPGISDLLNEIDRLDPEAKAKRWEELKIHVSDLMIIIQEGSRFLQPAEEV